MEDEERRGRTSAVEREAGNILRLLMLVLVLVAMLMEEERGAACA